MRHLKWIIVLSFLIFWSSCDRQYVPSSEGRCMVERFVYGEDSGSDLSYLFTYNSSQQIEVVSQEVQNGTEWIPARTFRHVYRADSIYIHDFSQFTLQELKMTVLWDEKVREVKKYTANSTVVYRFNIDHSQTRRITVTLDRVDGNSSLFDSRGVYYLNANNDVDSLEIFRNEDLHGAENKTGKIYYTYDEVNNPLKGLIEPHFEENVLPDVTFFSAHNKISEENDGVVNDFQIKYGTDPMPTEITGPGGYSQKLTYVNCTN